MKIFEEVDLKPDFFSVINTLIGSNDFIALKLQEIFFANTNDKSKYDWIDIDSDINLVNFQLKDAKHSGKVRLGRIVRDILTANEIKFEDADIEKFVNSYRAILSDSETTFEIWKGSQIVDAYKPENYLKKSTGGLGHSCMNGSNSNELELYIANPDLVNILILKREGKITGRALLWNQIEEVNGYTKYIDRIYTIQDHESILFRKWAVDNKYLCWDSISQETDEKPIRTKLKKWKLKEYPYLDTFALVDGEGYLQNFFKEGWGKVYVVNRDSIDLLSQEIIKNPITGEKDYYWYNYNTNAIFRDNFLKESYLSSDCVSENIKLFGYEVGFKTHKDNFQEIKKAISNFDLDNKFSIYIIHFINKYLSNKGLSIMLEFGWGGVKYDVKVESGKITLKVYYGSRWSDNYEEFGDLVISKSGKIKAEIKIISTKVIKSVIATDVNDLFNNKLNQLFSDPKVAVSVKSTKKILKFKSYLNKLMHKRN